MGMRSEFVASISRVRKEMKTRELETKDLIKAFTDCGILLHYGQNPQMGTAPAVQLLRQENKEEMLLQFPNGEVMATLYVWTDGSNYYSVCLTENEMAALHAELSSNK